MTWQDAQSIVNTLLPLLVLGGGIFAYRKGFSKDASDAQGRLITALKDEMALLRKKVESLEKDRTTHAHVLSTIRHVLKDYGLEIVINGDVVTLHDGSGNRKVARIQPIKPQANDEDEDAG